MLAFYLDHHVQIAIADGLRKRGVSVLTAFEDGYDEEDDEELLRRSSELDYVLVTYDFGFLEMSSRWQREGRSFPGIVFGFKTRVEVGAAIRYLEDLAKQAPPDTIADSVAYIPSRFPPQSP
jgi:hypothetical protein